MKCESRGKHPGVKLHLEPEEVEVILTYCEMLIKGCHSGPKHPAEDIDKLTQKIGKKILELQDSNPNLLQERSPEEIAAILAKEVEKQTIQLERLKAGKDWKKIDPNKLQDALLKHVKK